MNANEPDVVKLRKSLTMSKRTFYDHVFDMLIYGFCPQLDKKCAPEKLRLGVFGPYENAGKERIDKIAKLISGQGYGAVTGEGFYSMNAPDVFHRIEELFRGKRGTKVKKALQTFEVSDQDYFFHFPRLTNGAIIDLTLPRTQVYEANGCEYYGIPRLGYVFYPKLETRGRACNYLTNTNKAIIECRCPDYHFCDYPKLHRTLGLWCPFYNCIKIPFAVKKLFLVEDARLVATSKWTGGLEYLVLDFVKGNRTKHFLSKQEDY